MAPMSLLFLTAWLPTAQAQADDATVEEIVVWGDLFARWDDTRWFITTEMATPFSMTLQKDENLEFQTQQMQLRAVFSCSKDWKLSKRKYEVGCQIEDFSVLANIAQQRVKEADIERAQAVLDEIDGKLSGAKIELQVADDGRVLNLGLEGVPKNNRRQSEIHETLRQVLSRFVVGFNLKLQKFNQLHEGKWPEYNSTLMTMPLPPGVPGNLGSSLIVHYLNRYRGHVIVQSIGKGMTTVGDLPYETNLIGVSLFDDQEGYMTERVWALDGATTASAFFETQAYFHAGRIYLIGQDDRPDCGPSKVVNGRGQGWPGLDDWVPIERP